MLTGRAKIMSVCEYVSELADADCKMIVFAHHIEVLDSLEQVMIKSVSLCSPIWKKLIFFAENKVYENRWANKSSKKRGSS